MTTTYSVRDAWLDSASARDRMFDIRAFGAQADGATNDSSAVLSAITTAKALGGGVIAFPPRSTVNLGSWAGGSILFNVADLHDVTFLGDETLLVVNTTSDDFITIFALTNPERVHFRGLRFRDDGSNITIDWRGATCIQLIGSGGSPAVHAGFTIEDCQADEVAAFLILGNTSDTDARIRDVYVRNCIVRDSYYGVVCQENGDGLRGNWRCENVRRAYFPYGVEDHSVDVSVWHDGSSAGASSACLVKRYIRDTKNISLKARFFGSAANYGAAVTLEHQPTSGDGIIEDIDVDLHISEDIGSPDSMGPLRLKSYTAGGSEETLTTDNRWDRISFRGSVGVGNVVPVTVGCTQAVEGRLYLDPSIYKAGTAQPHYPGFMVRVAHDREFRTAQGDLTAATIVLPFAGLNSHPFTVVVRTFMHDNVANLAAQNTTYEEDVIIGYNAGGGAVTIQSTTQLHKVSQGTAGTVTFTASGENINVTFSGAPYNNAAGFARVETQFVGRGPVYS